jgi:hypothetical protein
MPSRFGRSLAQAWAWQFRSNTPSKLFERLIYDGLRERKRVHTDPNVKELNPESPVCHGAGLADYLRRSFLIVDDEWIRARPV